MRRENGLTLLEVLISVSLFLLVSVFSVSSYEHLYKKNKLKVTVNELTRIISYCKNLALAEGKELVLKPIGEQTDWAKGVELLDGKQIIHQWQWKQPALMVSWQGFSSNQHLVFTPTISRSILNGHFTLRLHNYSSTLYLNRVGRVRAA